MDILGRYAGLEKISYDPDLVGELWLIVDRYVHDPDALDAIREGWLGVVAEYLR